MHIVFGLPADPEAEAVWERFDGCVIETEPNDRQCEACGHGWTATDLANRTGRGQPKAAGTDACNLKASQAFWVYVIEMDAYALADRDQRDLGNGAIYVGYTSHDPEVRLCKHQAAVPPAAAVFKRMKDPSGSRLRMDLSLYAGPYTTEEQARRNERRTHNRLVSDGYKVFGDKGTRFMGVKKPSD